MTFLNLNCHHIHARNGQELGYDQVAGRAHPALYLNMAGIEIVCPAAYQGGAKETHYTGPYSLVSMRAGDAYVVEGVASEIADRVTGVQSMRKVNLEKLQNVGGNVLTYSGEHRDAWVQPEAVDTIEKAGYRDQGYTDSVERATLLMRSGAILTLYAVRSVTIATQAHWYRG